MVESFRHQGLRGFRGMRGMRGMRDMRGMSGLRCAPKIEIGLWTF